MAISIKNPRAEELLRQVAQITGESLTQAMITSLEARLKSSKSVRRTTSLETELARIRKRCSSLPVLDRRGPDEILGYDEAGAPD